MYFNYKYFKINKISGYMNISKNEVIFEPKTKKEFEYLLKNDSQIKSIEDNLKDCLRYSFVTETFKIGSFNIKVIGEA